MWRYFRTPYDYGYFLIRSSCSLLRCHLELVLDSATYTGRVLNALLARPKKERLRTRLLSEHVKNQKLMLDAPLMPRSKNRQQEWLLKKPDADSTRS